MYQKKWLLLILTLFHIYSSYSQNGASRCENAEPMCSDNNGVKIFNNVTGILTAGQYGCLIDTRNPAWFFIKVETDGDLKFKIIQNTSFNDNGMPSGTPLDVDFVAWGPFKTPDSNCNDLSISCTDIEGNIIECENNTDNGNFYPNNLDNTNIIDCSYSELAEENLIIDNAKANDYYILLITNYSFLPGKIKLEQTNFATSGAGTTDCTIIPGELGLDQILCYGSSITLDATPAVANDVSYSWELNTGSGFTTISGENNATLDINNNTTGTYRVTISENTSSFKVTDEVVIKYIPIPIANKVNDIGFCHLESDDIEKNSFDFNSNTTLEVIGAQDSDTLDVLYFLSEADAINNKNALPDVLRNITEFGNQHVYARIHNKEAEDACFDITSFQLSIYTTPKPNQPLNYEACDDNINGNDTDGFFNNFILQSKDAEILGDLNPNTFNISYHTTLSGAQTNNSTDVIDKNTPYRNTAINQQKIYTRIENINYPSCYLVSDENSTSFTPFSLIVNPLPVINTEVQLTQCSVNFDLSTTINLTLSESSISKNHINETFKYYPSENDAILNTSEITETSTYLIANGDTVWVRVIFKEKCYRIAKLNLSVSFNGPPNYNKAIIECDDEIDYNGNDSDADGITYFDLSQVPYDILNEFSINNNLEVLIFESEEERDSALNPILNLINYRNIDLPAYNPVFLYYKISDKTNNNCVAIGKFTIQTNPLPNYNITNPQVFCLKDNIINLEAEQPNETYAYQWTKDNDINIIGNQNNLDITSGGKYHVTAINNTTLCERTKTISVIASDIASISETDITIIDDSNNNSITINQTNLGSGNYEYALFNDDETELIIAYQDDPYFENLDGGIYTISIQDKNNCGTTTHQVSIIDFPDFFTPNGDSYNDTWSVKGVNVIFYPTSTMYIFDRFGKKITEISIDNKGWDGTENGKQLPQNDYWYSIQLIDTNGNIRNKKGHFSLLRK